MVFIETSVFTKQIQAMASDEELRALQETLIANPYAGTLIVGSGGLRKIRMRIADSGARGGARIIYFLATQTTVYLLLAYPKSAKDTLSKSELLELKKLTAMLKQENP